MTVRVVTDSTADLPAGLAAERRIEVVPLTVLFGDEQFRDGVDITASEFYARLARAAELPTTSQPPPALFREAYERLIADGATEILSIHVSGKLSGTLDSARQGAQGLDARIVHVDSQMASLAVGIGVLRAADAIADGASLDEAAAVVETQFGRTHVYIVLDTLEYLRRGGRLGRASAVIGTMLKVKPVLSFVDGEVAQLARGRTQAKALEVSLKLAAEQAPFEYMTMMHTSSRDGVDALLDRLKSASPDATVVNGQMGPAIGVHAGPRTLAFAVVSSPSSDG
ncbi:MAG TPA: DegV family protein [Dehalococcoidia bacterium]|nr:DegV family protein [Dehalococcoidia bacterium]